MSISFAIACAVRRRASQNAASRAGVNRTVGTARLMAPWKFRSLRTAVAMAVMLYAPAGLWPTVRDRFRIDWQASQINYYVDDMLLASHAITVAGPMRPVAASVSAYQ